MKSEGICEEQSSLTQRSLLITKSSLDPKLDTCTVWLFCKTATELFSHFSTSFLLRVVHPGQVWLPQGLDDRHWCFRTWGFIPTERHFWNRQNAQAVIPDETGGMKQLPSHLREGSWGWKDSNERDWRNNYYLPCSSKLVSWKMFDTHHK